MDKKIVYIAHPISGDVMSNLDRLTCVISSIYSNEEFKNVIPVVPYYVDCLTLDDSDPLQRKRGIDNNTSLIETGLYDELWLTGDRISFGMNEEVKLFVKLGKPVINYIGKF